MKTKARTSRRLLDEKWYIMLVSAEKIGRHKLVGKKVLSRSGDGRRRHNTTTVLANALSFDDRATAEAVSRLVVEPKYRNFVQQIPRYEKAAKRPRTKKIRTDYGTIRVKEDQGIFWGGEEG